MHINYERAEAIGADLSIESQPGQGTEGELYDLNEDPGELVNLWDDPSYAAVKSDMIETIRKDLVSLPNFKNKAIPGALIQQFAQAEGTDLGGF